MLNNFKFYNPTKIYFGIDCIENISSELKNIKKVMFVYEGEILKKIGVYEKVINELKKNKVDILEIEGVTPNPEDKFCRKIADIAKKEKVDLVLAVGGGSVIDASKGIAILATNPNDYIFDYIANQIKPKNKPLKLGVVLTSAATSSENSPAMVISSKEMKQKATFFSEDIFPLFAFCDPQFTTTLPQYQTAIGAFDVLSHVIEQYLSLETFDASEIPHLHILKSLIKWVPIALKEPTNIEARANIMWSSTMALNGHGYVGKNPGWYAHGLSYPLTTYFNIPHGAALALVMPKLIEYQLKNGNNLEVFCKKLEYIAKICFGHKNITKIPEDLKKLITSWKIKTNIYEYDIHDINDKLLDKISSMGFLGHSNDSFLSPTLENAKHIYNEIF